MQKNKVYIGNINIIENETNKLYQSLSPLVSLGNGHYVNLDWVVSLKDYLKLYRALITGDYSDDIILSEKIPNNGVYVDQESLIPYYDKDCDKQISISKVKNDLMMDPRLPRGIDYCADGTSMIYVRKPNPKRVASSK